MHFHNCMKENNLTLLQLNKINFLLLMMIPLEEQRHFLLIFLVNLIELDQSCCNLKKYIFIFMKIWFNQ